MDCTEVTACKKGHNGFSFDHIARDVGIRKASMYHYFPTKADLLFATFKRYSYRIYDFFDDPETEKLNGGQRVTRYIDLSRQILRDGTSICLSIALCVDYDSLAPELTEQLKLFHQRNIEWLEKAFEISGTDGSLRDVVDSRKEAIATLSLIDGAIILARLHEDTAVFDQAVDQLLSRISVTDQGLTNQGQQGAA